MTKCDSAWIVAVFCVLPILPLFNLQFCKVCLHFSYTCFSSAFHLLFICFSSAFHLLATPAFYLTIRAICGISLILNDFFLPKRSPKLAINATKMASPWFLKGFLFGKCVMSLLKNAQAQIIITSHCCMLMQCYYI